MSRAFIAAALLLLSLQAAADTVSLDKLGLLRLEFAPVEAIDGYRGQPLAARVAFRPGEAVSMVAPHRVQQIRYLVPPGSAVTAGQPIASTKQPFCHPSDLALITAAEPHFFRFTLIFILLSIN